MKKLLQNSIRRAFSTFQYTFSYGQNSQLILDLSRAATNLDTHIKTKFFDAETYFHHDINPKAFSFDENGRCLKVNATNIPLSHNSIEPNSIFIGVPLYSSYDVITKGDLYHLESDNGSGKINGNVSILQTSPSTSIYLNDIQSENAYFMLEKNGKLEWKKSIKAANLLLTGKDGATMTGKLLAIAKMANLEILNGKFDIGSVYIGDFKDFGKFTLKAEGSKINVKTLQGNIKGNFTDCEISLPKIYGGEISLSLQSCKGKIAIMKANPNSRILLSDSEVSIDLSEEAKENVEIINYTL